MSNPQDLKTTPLYQRHTELGARMVPFAGFDMPVQYTGVIDEHMAVRNAAGLFDVSHMGEVMVEGPEAFGFVQNLVTNDASKLVDGQAMYSAMCNEQGGIVDDLLVYRISDVRYLIVINASNIDKDVAWMRAHNPMGAMLTDISEETALLAVQGPKALEIAASIAPIDVTAIPYYRFKPLEPGALFGSHFGILSHTGYTGEPGLEIYCDKDRAVEIWDRVMEAGAPLGLKPAGLGARDTLRLEAGYPLYGNDLSDDTNPLEAGLGWVTKLQKGPFVGRDALLAASEKGISRRLVGFVMEDRGVPRHGYPVTDGKGNVVGEVTSGTQSPLLSRGIGLAYVPNTPEYTTEGQAVYISVRDKELKASVKKPPFHK